MYTCSTKVTGSFPLKSLISPSARSEPWRRIQSNVCCPQHSPRMPGRRLDRGRGLSSTSLKGWLAARSRELDEIEQAHAAVGGRRPGRRWATRQLNHAYALILSAQFQGFARDLHSESVDYLVASVEPDTLGRVLHTEFLFARALDRGNPNPGNIGADFNRLGLEFWELVTRDDTRNPARKSKLEHLCKWRNAIAHQRIESARLVPNGLQLGALKDWRRACDGLARSFDAVMKSHIQNVLGSSPW